MDIIGWILWAVIVWFATSSLYFFMKKSGGIQAGSMSTMVNQLILVAWPLLFSEFNKLHLAWLGALTYFWGVPATMLFSPRLFFRASKHLVVVGAVVINIALLTWLTP